MGTSSLLVNVSKLTTCDYESVIQSLITNVDLVWLNALAFEINDPDVQNKLYMLKEAGLLKVWDYEMALNSYSSPLVDKVFTVDEYKDSKQYLNALMEEYIAKNLQTVSDFTTFKIEQQNLFSNFLTARFCGAESIIQRDSSRINVANGQTELFSQYSQQLFNKTDIYSVGGLSVDEILELRKYSKYFRKRIQKEIDNRVIKGDIPLSIIREDCEKISKEYCEEINSRIKSGATGSGTGLGLVLDIASFWLPDVTIFSITQKLWDAIFHTDKRGFVMYLTTLRKSTGIKTN